MFFVFKKSKFVIISLLFSLVVVLSLVCVNVGATAVYYNKPSKLLPIYSVKRSDNKISISFDAAYGDDYTLKILDILDEYNVKCTFFLVEFWVDKYPHLVKEIDKRGHEIGTHSKTHPNMSKLTETEMQEELISSSNKIKEITGKQVKVFRPPFGDYNNKLIEVCGKLNLYPIQWSVDSLDWKNLSAKEIYNRVVTKTTSGSIILCHNNGLHTSEALPYILANLIEKGYEFTPICDLIYKDNYTIDVQGVQSQALK